MAVDEQIDRERGIHGREWDSFHEGYFSDKNIARTLIDRIRASATTSHPDVIVDLGGGTGFLLSELSHHTLGSGIHLVNLDCSDAQLGTARSRGIDSVHGSIDTFRRRDIDDEGKKFLYIMRSVLHYYGMNGLLPALRHIRSQAKEGELFVHQTASFDKRADAACMNFIYEKMRTIKWYPTIEDLSGILRNTGWAVSSTYPVTTLPLTSRDLARRYKLDEHDVRHICEGVTKQFREKEDVFRLCEGGFCAYLHYRIFVCKAASHNI
jgi:SAM-dependent methyltransferase